MKLTILIIAVFVLPSLNNLYAEYRVKNNVSGCVNVRPEPKTSSIAFTCLTAGTQLTVIKAIPYWREIVFNEDQRGWIAKKFIEPTGVSVTASTSTSIPEDAFLKVHFIDVGQGDAILIQTHDDGIDGNDEIILTVVVFTYFFSIYKRRQDSHRQLLLCRPLHNNREHYILYSLSAKNSLFFCR